MAQLAMGTERQRLVNAARRLLATPGDAEDAVQDTYLRAFSASLSWSAPPPAWLYTVLRNTAIDRLRRNRLEAAYADVEATPSASSETLLEARSDCEAALRQLLSRVSPAEAVAMLLRDVFEFDYDEIARTLGKTEAACRQLLHRARKRAGRTVSTADAEEAYLVLCWRAIEARDPAPLMELLQTTTAGTHVACARGSPQHSAQSATMLVQVHGRYAIALVLDGVVLCVVPVGLQETTRACEEI